MDSDRDDQRGTIDASRVPVEQRDPRPDDPTSRPYGRRKESDEVRDVGAAGPGSDEGPARGDDPAYGDRGGARDVDRDDPGEGRALPTSDDIGTP